MIRAHNSWAESGFAPGIDHAAIVAHYTERGRLAQVALDAIGRDLDGLPAEPAPDPVPGVDGEGRVSLAWLEEALGGG